MFNAKLLSILLVLAVVVISFSQSPRYEIMLNRPDITGLTGGGSTNLDGVTTTGLSIGTIVLVYDHSSGITRIYRLLSGTDAENSPLVIRPDDFNAVSNAKVWKLSLSSDADETGSSDTVSSGDNDLSDTIVVNGQMKVIGELIADSIQAVGSEVEIDGDMVVHGDLSVDGSYPIDNDWTISTAIGDGANDTTLVSGGKWGIYRSGNTGYGNACSTHVNLGISSTAGSSGQNYKYCTVGGGKSNVAGHNYSTVGGGNANEAMGAYAFVGGGSENYGGSAYSTVAGGSENEANGYAAFVGGGAVNSASGPYSVMGGGYSNSVEDSFSVVSGGYRNRVYGKGSAVPGGYADSVSGDFSFAFGRRVVVNSNYTAQFFSTSYPGKVNIVDVLHLAPRSSAPSSPSEGDIYVNSTNHHIYCYLNGSWVQLDNDAGP